MAGAIAAVRENRDARVCPLPVTQSADGATIIDAERLTQTIRLLVEGNEAVVLIEEPVRHAISSANTIAGCWRNFGRITATLDLARFDYSAVVKLFEIAAVRIVADESKKIARRGKWMRELASKENEEGEASTDWP